MRHSRLWTICLSVTLGFLMVACTENDPANRDDTIRIATVPDQKNKKIQITYQKLIGHIAEHTGLKTELLVPGTYEELLHLFNSNQIDLALFGGVTYVKAHLQSNALPLVMRDMDGQIRSAALVHASNPANSLKDLKDASIAFGSRLSTSGHFMPRYFFQQENIIPETFFSSITYSGAHDLTAEWVRDGKVDLGLANSDVVNEMFLDGRLNSENIRIIWLSPPYHDNIWAIQSDMSKQKRTLIRDCFLHLSHDTEHQSLLEELGANYYIPATNDDFEDLQQIIQQLEQEKPVP